MKPDKLADSICAWAYRMVDTDNGYVIHEVYYNHKAEIVAITEGPMTPNGETPGELMEDLKHMILDIQKEAPVTYEEYRKLCQI